MSWFESDEPPSRLRVETEWPECADLDVRTLSDGGARRARRHVEPAMTAHGPSTDADPARRYFTAGLTTEETAALTAVAADVGSAEPLAAYVAVPLGAVQTVLAVLDRLVDLAVGIIERATQQTDGTEPRQGGE